MKFTSKLIAVTLTVLLLPFISRAANPRSTAARNRAGAGVCPRRGARDRRVPEALSSPAADRVSAVWSTDRTVSRERHPRADGAPVARRGAGVRRSDRLALRRVRHVDRTAGCDVEAVDGRAAARVDSSLDQVESNDDERMTAIAKLAYKRGEYGYALFED